MFSCVLPCAPDRRSLRRSALIVAAGVLITALLAACGGASGQSSNGVTVNGGASSSRYDGDELSQPVVLSGAAQTATFTTSAGTTTTLAALQSGQLMLVYFGYTHCPDVCPTTMADLGQALQQVPVQDREHTQVVFVTSDPARDTGPVMKSWLANFDAGLPRPFIGLTASLTQIDQIATSLGIPLSPPVTEANGTITVEHGAQTLAFVNGKANVLWLAGTTPASYAHDIMSLNAGTELMARSSWWITHRPAPDLIDVARAAGRGDERALSELIRRASPIVWRACAGLVDRGCADDLTQDTFVRAIRSLPSYRGESDPTRWLLTIARRVCAEEIDRRQRSRRLVARISRQRPFTSRPSRRPIRPTSSTPWLGWLPNDARRSS